MIAYCVSGLKIIIKTWLIIISHQIRCKHFRYEQILMQWLISTYEVSALHFNTKSCKENTVWLGLELTHILSLNHITIYQDT